MTKHVSVNADGAASNSGTLDLPGGHLFVLPDADTLRTMISARGERSVATAPDAVIAAVAAAIAPQPEMVGVEARLLAPTLDTATMLAANARHGVAIQSRHVHIDPRELLTVPGCATDDPNAKDFNGYARHAQTVADATANPALAPVVPHDEGVLTVTVGGSVSGLIDVTGDTDTIQVALTAGQTYSVYLYGSGANAISDSFLSVYAPDGTTLINEDDDGGVGLYSLITFTATTTGTYNLIAESFSNPGDPGTGAWTITVHQQGADEAPSAPPSVVAASLGLNYGFLSPAGTDEDVYSITLTAGMIYNFEVAGGADYNTDFLSVPLGEIDTIIRIYNSAGTLIYTNDDIDFDSGDISSAVSFIAPTSGTYYVEVDGYSGQTGGYVLDITQTDPSTLDPLDAINWGGDGNKVDNSDTILIYFATNGETYDGVTDIGGWTPYLQQQALEAFQTYSQFANLTFAITTNPAIADFHLVTTTSDEFLAYFNPPGETNAGVGVFATNGTGWDPTGADGSMEPGGYGWITFIHEFGHALGMAHPHDNGGGSDVLPGVTGPFGSYGIYDLNQGVYTTMSYNDGWQFAPGVDANGFPVPDTLDYGYQATPMAFDIALMQIKYGAVAHNTGADTYTLGTANVAGTYYQAIWDTGGTDAITYSGSGNAHIDLTAATLDYSATGSGVVSFVEGVFGGYTIANGVVIENATGGSGNDVLIGNNVVNILTGNDGNDIMMGRGGNDQLFGGAGQNTAVFAGNQADYVVTAIGGGSYTVQDTNLANGDEGTDTIQGVTYLQFADATVNLTDAPGNQAPTLTGLSSSVIFNENTVNAGPQLIDSDVTFGDTDGNFNGGTLVVSGLLAQDTVAIRNQGTLTGQVGVSGANLTYGGVVIGTIAGGNGTTLTVTFNAAATSLAVEAVIENLTYANASQNPTADRTLTINVTDAAGAGLGAPTFTPGPFVELTGGSNPLSELPSGAGPALAFVDVDNDGDLDIVYGNQPGTLRYFQNGGSNAFTEVTGGANPFNGFVLSGGSTTYSSPAAIDLDGDGDLDLAIGSNSGVIDAFRNNGNGTWTQLTGASNPFNGIDAGSFSDPTGIDFDGDGDHDLIVGTSTGTFATLRNDGGGVFVNLTGASNPLNGFNGGSFASATAGDVDHDGDEDLIVGRGDGTIATFLNNGSGVFTPVSGAANPFNGVDVGSYSLPVLVDLDGDGDVDLVTGAYGAAIRTFQNTSTTTPGAAPTVQIHVNAQNDAPSGTNGSATINQDASYIFTTADFGFSDVDGNSFLAVSITAFPTNGKLMLDPDGPGGAGPIDLSTVGVGVFVSVADIAAGHLYFQPDAGEFGANYASISFKLQDDGGIANGGVDLDPTANTFSFAVASTNTAPLLTQLDSPVTFLENTVNATPQLLDADVTFVDAEGNFDGGKLTVGGLLPEDSVGVRNQGTGAGQIGVSGANVTYGGVVIGTIAGGTAGAMLTITLNAAATTVAVEHLIENLTYANSSDTPTASRTLSINVYDDEGLNLGGTASFVEHTGAQNPFDSVVADGNGSIPTFVDVDGDGDADLVVGSQTGTLQVFSNQGNGVFTELTGAANPLDGFDVGASGTYSAPCAIDVDGDGDLDLVVGSNYGDLVFLENDGAGGWSNSGFISGASVYAFSTPTAVDLDGDGLQDIVVGSLTGFLYGFHNNGDGTFTELTGANDPFLSVAVQYFAAPSFVDIDGDGDMDAVVGDYYGNVTVFTNDGGTFSEAVDNPFSGYTFSSIPAFTFYDVDGDGDPDVVAGSFDGDIRVFENESVFGVELVVNVTPEADAPPLSASHLSDDETYIEDTPLNLIDIVVGDSAPAPAADAGAPVVFIAPPAATITATLTLSDPNAGKLTVGTFGSATATFVRATGVWTITGSMEDVNAALAAVTFKPAPNYNGDFTLTTSITDGTNTVGGSKDFTGTPVNDAPTGTDVTIDVQHGVKHVLTLDDFGFTDIENDDFVSVTITTLPAVGRLLLRDTGGGPSVAVTAGQVISAADIAAGKLIYKPTPFDSDPATGSFTFQVHDDGGTSNGGVEVDATPNTMTFTVPPNHAPEGADTTIGVTHTVPHIVELSEFGFSDVDGDSFLSVSITTLPTVGHLTFEAAPGVFVAVSPGMLITASDIAAGKLVYKPDPNFSGPHIGSFTFQVHDDGGIYNGGVDTDQSPNTITYDATPEAAHVAPPGQEGSTGAGDNPLASARSGTGVDHDTRSGTLDLGDGQGAAERFHDFVIRLDDGGATHDVGLAVDAMTGRGGVFAYADALGHDPGELGALDDVQDLLQPAYLVGGNWAFSHAL